MTDEEKKEMYEFFSRKAAEYQTPEGNSMGIGKKLDDIVYQLKVLNDTLRRKNNG